MNHRPQDWVLICRLASSFNSYFSINMLMLVLKASPGEPPSNNYLLDVLTHLDKDYSILISTDTPPDWLLSQTVDPLATKCWRFRNPLTKRALRGTLLHSQNEIIAHASLIYDDTSLKTLMGNEVLNLIFSNKKDLNLNILREKKRKEQEEELIEKEKTKERIKKEKEIQIQKEREKERGQKEIDINKQQQKKSTNEFEEPTVDKLKSNTPTSLKVSTQNRKSSLQPNSNTSKKPSTPRVSTSMGRSSLSTPRNTSGMIQASPTSRKNGRVSASLDRPTAININNNNNNNSNTTVQTKRKSNLPPSPSRPKGGGGGGGGGNILFQNASSSSSSSKNHASSRIEALATPRKSQLKNLPNTTNPTGSAGKKGTPKASPLRSNFQT